MPTAEERLHRLMREALAGSEPAYRELLAELADRLRAYYRRRLDGDHAAAEDLVQETLLAVHTRRFTYDVSRPVTAWIYAIARYKLVDHLRALRARPSVPIDDVDGLFTPDAAEAVAARLDVERALGTLPSQPRTLIRAIKLEGRSVAEVSASSGLSESAVKVAVHRGLQRLARRLKGSDTP